MIEKDNIKELFSQRFSDFEAEFSPQVWDNIQLELGKTPVPATSGGGTSIWSNYSYWIIGAVVTSVVAVTVVLWDGSPSTDSVELNKQTELVVAQPETTTLEETPVSTENENPIENATEKSINQPESEITYSSSKQEQKSKVKASLEVEVAKSEVKSNGVTETKKTESNTNSKKTASSTSSSPELKIPVEEVSTPNKIDVAAQSSVIAMPMAGKVPLKVNFSTLADAKNIKWNFSDGTTSTELEPEHTFTVAGLYFVTMIAELPNGEHVMEKAVVEVKPNNNKGTQTNKEAAVFTVPNFFSPNGDGTNDEFSIQCTGVETLSLSIYAVNGQLVYQTENPEDKWNGSDLSGSPVPDGTYYYLINAIGLDQNIYVPKGYITIRRSN